MTYLGKQVTVSGSLHSNGSYRVVSVTVAGPRFEPRAGFRDTACAQRERDRRAVLERWSPFKIHESAVLPIDICAVCGRAAPLVDSECPDCRH